MPLRDIVVAALSRPAGRVVEVPVRDIVNSVLQEQGFASPAEVRALQDEIRALKVQVVDLEKRVVACEARALEVEEVVTALRNEPRTSASTGTQTPAPESTVSPVDLPRGEPATRCRVEGCSLPSYSNGFCATHANAWMAGTLPGFVSPEGLIGDDGRAWQVDPTLAGQGFTVAGDDVQISGLKVSATRLPAQ